jgi:hypothetical protein
MYEKKQVVYKSPDLSKMQVVVIDGRTRIYIEQGSDPEEARIRYITKLESQNTFYARSRRSIAV